MAVISPEPVETSAVSPLGEAVPPARYPLGLSPLWFLLRDHVSLGGDVTVTRFERGPNVFQIGIVQTDEPDAGTVTLVLGDKPLELQQWTIVDNKNQEVRVALYNAEFGVQLENKLFRTPEKKRKGS